MTFPVFDYVTISILLPNIYNDKTIYCKYKESVKSIYSDKLRNHSHVNKLRYYLPNDTIKVSETLKR